LIYQTLGSHLYTGYALLDRSDMLWRLNSPVEARDWLNQVPSLADRLDSKYKQVMSARIHLISSQMLTSRRLLPEAIAEGQKALAMAGPQIRYTAIEARYTLGLAMALSNSKREGKQLCEEAAEMALNHLDQKLRINALLALAEAKFEIADFSGALKTAEQAQTLSGRASQQESQWRAHFIAARASERMKDHRTAREHLLQVKSLLSSLRQKWGSEPFNRYLGRPDIQLYLKQPGAASVAP
jgi:hypothetical protein